MAKTSTKKAEAVLENEITHLYGKYCSNIQVDIFSLGKIMDAGKDAARAAAAKGLKDAEREDFIGKALKAKVAEVNAK